MVKTTTLDSFQASLSDTPETEAEPVQVSNPLADLAERMVRERSTADTATRQEIAEQLQALGVLETVDPHMALGEIKGRVREAAEAAGILADYELISAEAERIWTHFGDTRRASEATYTVSPDGLVDGYQRTEKPTPQPAAQELPGIEPKALKVPADSVFGDDGEFAVSSALAARARVLISRHPDHLDHLNSLSVVYLWKKQGGKSKGRVVYGKCSKPSGLLKHFAETQFVIWLAADHCRAAGFDDRQLEALLFHEMLHTGLSEVDENTGRGGGPTLVPHELEVFRAEVEIYGLWAPDLKSVGPAFHQLSFSAAVDAATPITADEMDAQPARGEVFERADLEPTAGDEHGVLGYDDGAGVLIHPDGTPLTAEEIAEMEAAEARDDDYPDEEGQYTSYISGADEGEEELEGMLASEGTLPGDVAIAADDRRKWGADA